MTTRRRIICSILSTLCLSSCAILPHDPPHRVVRVRVLADVPFRARNPNWEAEARGLIEAASDYYEREFGIRFVSQSVSPWPQSERIPSTPNLLAKLGKEFPLQSRTDGVDLIVAFTAEGVSRYLTAGRPRVDRIGNCDQGLGGYAVVPIGQVFRYHGVVAEPEVDVITLIHEIGHIFGAEHVDDVQSIMHEEFGYRTEFDLKNRAVIQKNRLCPFAK